MIIFGFSVSVYIINSKVNRDYSVIICPYNGFKVGPIYNRVMFTILLSVNKIHMSGIRFIQNSIIDNKKSSFRNDKILYFFP